MNMIVNPVEFMLNQYINKLGKKYEKSFQNNSDDFIILKLEAFTKSLITFLDFKGYSDFTCKKHELSIDIFKGSTLLVTYSKEFLSNIKNENSLKFQFLIEWGILMELSDKEQLLIAL